MLVMAPGRRAVLVATSVLLTACIPGALSVGETDGGPSGDDGPSMGPDGAQGDAGADQSSGMDGSSPTDGDSGQDAVAQPDVSDAAPLPDGYIQCAATSVQCNVAGGDQCCLDVFGMTTADGGSVYQNTSAACEVIGGPNCGAYIGTGNNFDEQLPQTCSTARDCTGGASCCVAFSDAGTVRFGTGITCQAICSAPDRIICRNNGDCPTATTCQPETDPVLSHLYARYCR